MNLRIRELDRSLAAGWRRAWSDPRCRWMVIGWVGATVNGFVMDVFGLAAGLVTGSILVMTLTMAALAKGKGEGGE